MFIGTNKEGRRGGEEEEKEEQKKKKKRERGGGDGEVVGEVEGSGEGRRLGIEKVFDINRHFLYKSFFGGNVLTRCFLLIQLHSTVNFDRFLC
ncbi:Hypothetical predicted protein [Octopus vulgaris]|uniref:Uncharacterized protein n=1 Tax=Octopus vulgaris TaxID=6645 RepID=A0AA36FH06_OCTVU|nr:Hypothetical predicted protein [Octopus vulgaris]